LKFPHRIRARRTGTAQIVAAAVSAVTTIMSGGSGAQAGTGRRLSGLGVPDLAALAGDSGRR
jgi:hypothetical protein